MGCGPSKSPGHAAPAAAAATPAGPAPPPAQQAALPSKLVETMSAEGSSSRETTPNEQQQGAELAAAGGGGSLTSTHGSTRSLGQESARSASLPGSQRAASHRSMQAKQLSNSQLVQKARLPGPTRDYKGLPLQRREEPKLAHVTSLAGAILKAPVAMVVLGHPDRMLLVSAHGLEPQDGGWLPDVCAWALAGAGALLTLEDVATDARTHKLPWVAGEPGIGFWAGAPVHTLSGDWLGVLCVLDFEPRPGTGTLCAALPNLAEMVARELPAAAPAGRADDALFRAMDSYWDGSVLVDVRAGRWRIKYSNQAFSSMTGVDRQLLPGRELWDVVAPLPGAEKPWEAQAGRLAAMEEFDVLPVVLAPAWRPPSCRDSASGRPGSGGGDPGSSGSGRTRRFRITMRPMTEEIMATYSPDGGAGALSEVAGWYFAVFTHLAAPRDAAGAAVAAAGGGGGVPFEGLEVGPIIGRGSFGCVFRAVWAARLVAVKVIEFRDIGRVDAAGSPLEASLMLQMKHPNVLETINFATQHKLEEQGEAHAGPGTPPAARNATLQFWLMLEFCDMGPLSDAIRGGLFHKDVPANGKGGGVPLMARILETALDIARGLAHIHAHSILHGDLTAGNVLLTSGACASGRRDFVAKIADFGLSRQAITSKVETNTYGTVTHMPPELLNDGLLSKAADVYAFGVLLFEMLTRRQAWEGLRHPQVIHAIAVQRRHPQLPPAAPGPYKGLADRCMASEPEQRPEMEAVVTELKAMLESKHLK